MSADAPPSRRGGEPRLTRRALVAGAGAAFATFAARPAAARGRLPVGGRIALRVPWPVGAIDPHRIDDVPAALFGDALFDALYAQIESGAIAPALAEGDPEPDGDGLRVRIRGGVTTAQGRPIDARDVVASLSRARAAGGQAWLAEVPPPGRVDRLAVRFAMRDAAKLTRALASPIAAIVPLAFAPDRPDGTGPFRAERRADAWVLARNPRAARGPSLLDEIVVRAAPDLAASLRSFESGADDLGWLGSGLHEPRAGAKPFDHGVVAWAVLRAGREAGAWDQPGVPQRVCDGIAPSRLSYLVLGPAWSADREEGWSGPPADVIVREDAPWLIELARAVAATLTRPGHELSVRPLTPTDFAQRRSSRAFALAIDAARSLAPSPLGQLAGLATADNAAAATDVVKHPPRLAEAPARTLTRTMRVGVLGEIRMQGARIADLAVPPSPSAGWDLGLATRARRTP